MRKALSIMALLAFVAMLIIGCGGGGQKSVTKETVSNIPDWYDNAPIDPNYIFEVGSAESRDLQLARDKASDAARMSIAKTVETRFQGFSKRFQEEVGLGEDAQYLDQFTQATKAVVSLVMSGAQVEEAKTVPEDGVYRSFVLMKYPVGATSQQLMNKLKQQEQLYTKFRSTQVFEELEKETQQYEEFKKSQGL